MDETRLSKRLAWLLRHGAHAAGLAMDEAGWTSAEAVAALVGLSRAQLEELVRINIKQRLELDGDRLRACQGHSFDGTPVTLDGLERSWVEHRGAAPLWHGTRPDAVPGIARAGIQPQRRTHVHLAPARDSVVGKRTNTPVMLAVAPERLRARGLGVFAAPNGVLLVRAVPPDCIVDVVAEATARARLAELLALFPALVRQSRSS